MTEEKPDRKAPEAAGTSCVVRPVSAPQMELWLVSRLVLRPVVRLQRIRGVRRWSARTSSHDYYRLPQWLWCLALQALMETPEAVQIQARKWWLLYNDTRRLIVRFEASGT
jgi:hypothetical protein